MNASSQLSVEMRIELLKERIYATLTLLAVLLTVDPERTTAFNAALIVGGTSLSLWAASMASALMSRRIVTQQPSGHHAREDLVKHSPLLLAAALPFAMIFLAEFDLISVRTAINLAIAASFALLLGWSLYSARAFKVSRAHTLMIAVLELAIGIGVVALKTALKS